MIPLYAAYLLPVHCKRRFKRDSKAGLRFIHGLYDCEGGLDGLKSYTINDSSIGNSKHSYSTIYILYKLKIINSPDHILYPTFFRYHSSSAVSLYLVVNPLKPVNVIKRIND